MTEFLPTETDLSIGHQSLHAYSRLSYTMWHALAEFIDNSTQSRLNYGNLIDGVLQEEGTPLVVEIIHDRPNRQILIKDNSIGMNLEKLIEALRIAQPTGDSRGRSRYGMGMKTAACWIGKKWKVVTCEWDSGVEWTAEIDVQKIANTGAKIPITPRIISDKSAHYTHIIISDLNRNIQRRTEETILNYLGSMYRFDVNAGILKLLYNNVEVTPPDVYEFDTDPSGNLMKLDLPPCEVGGKEIKGWIAIMKKGGRKYGGFSLFQNQRQIQGYPNAWKPKSIFGGEDDEGANNLIAQRLTGLIELDRRFEVSHTKDAILFEGDEEEDLEKYLMNFSKTYRDYAIKRRNTSSTPWKREKIQDLVASITKEFTTPEVQDAITNAVLPSFEVISTENSRAVEALKEEEEIGIVEVAPGIRVKISFQEKSEWEQYVTIAAGADGKLIHVIINGLHPYYLGIQTVDSIDECLRQYIFDAVAEFKVSLMKGRVNPDSTRRLKDSLLRAPSLHVENVAAGIREGIEIEAEL